MQEIKVSYEHGKLVFKLEDDDKEFFINSKSVLKLLDRQRVSETFQSLDPAVVYREWEVFDFVVQLETLKQRGWFDHI